RPHLFLTLLRPPIPPLFPYTTLFRSHRAAHGPEDHLRGGEGERHAARGEAGRRLRGRHGLQPPAVQLRRLVHHVPPGVLCPREEDRKSTRLNSSHVAISYAVFCLKKK